MGNNLFLILDKKILVHRYHESMWSSCKKEMPKNHVQENEKFHVMVTNKYFFLKKGIHYYS